MEFFRFIVRDRRKGPKSSPNQLQPSNREGIGISLSSQGPRHLLHGEKRADRAPSGFKGWLRGLKIFIQGR